MEWTMPLGTFRNKFIILPSKTTSEPQVIKLTQNERGFWCDEFGTEYGFIDNSNAKDLKKRCGVWPFALPMLGVFTELNEACAVHDNMYGNPVFQAYNHRSTADAALELLLENNHKWYQVLRLPFKVLVRIFGKNYWDNEETND